ncbi:hypothetical protein BD770DRAFT_402693 [Pilaira anomala]|nr:hypothetical protein BD770DRAFT_402693 [Pilaira anomala]
MQNRTETIFNKMKTEAECLWDSMDDFHNLWKKICEYCKSNNIELFKEWDSLHISIYKDWKEISDTCKQFQQNLKIILRELKIAKVVGTFDINTIEEIAQEVKKFSEATGNLMWDKHCIELSTLKYINIVNEESINRSSKNTPRETKRETSSMFCSVVKKCARSFYTVDIPAEDEARAKEIENKSGIDELAELSKDLSKLPDFSIPMNVAFKNLGDLINEAIQNISVGLIDTEIQVESLIYITQELQKIFDITYTKASEYEGVTRMLLMKSNPRFLINQ